MQLDVGVSPPANIMTFRPGLTHLTFDLIMWQSFRILPIKLSEIWIFVKRDRQTDRQRDKRRRIWAHRAICTGGLKNAGWPFQDMMNPLQIKKKHFLSVWAEEGVTGKFTYGYEICQLLLFTSYVMKATSSWTLGEFYHSLIHLFQEKSFCNNNM